MKPQFALENVSVTLEQLIHLISERYENVRILGLRQSGRTISCRIFAELLSKFGKAWDAVDPDLLRTDFTPDNSDKPLQIVLNGDPTPELVKPFWEGPVGCRYNVYQADLREAIACPAAAKDIDVYTHYIAIAHQEPGSRAVSRCFWAAKIDGLVYVATAASVCDSSDTITVDTTRPFMSNRLLTPRTQETADITMAEQLVRSLYTSVVLRLAQPAVFGLDPSSYNAPTSSELTADLLEKILETNDLPAGYREIMQRRHQHPLFKGATGSDVSAVIELYRELTRLEFIALPERYAEVDLVGIALRSDPEIEGEYSIYAQLKVGEGMEEQVIVQSKDLAAARRMAAGLFNRYSFTPNISPELLTEEERNRIVLS